MSRYALSLAMVAFSLGGAACGGTYYEHDGLVATGPPAVTYADPANAPVGTSATQDAEGQTTYYASEEVQVGASAETYEDTDPSALTEFRTTLDPYGTWVDDGVYGTVWVPSTTVVGADFSPYVTAGHWVYEDEYVWVSDYDWGWAPFHYGRWVYISGRGWGWIPGRRYAGAWVSWRVGYDGWGYVGWGPLAPAWYWRGGYAVGVGFAVTTPWVYCAHGDLFHPQVGGRLVASAQVGNVAAHTRAWVPAQPGVAGGGRGLANPSVSGPPPGQLGIQNPPRMPSGHAGLLKAQGYSRPESAQAYGARPPQMAQAHTTLPANSSLAPVVRGPTALPRYTAPSTLPHGNDAYTSARPQQPAWRPQPQTDGAASFRPQPQPWGNSGSAFRPSPTPQYSPPAQTFHPSPTPQYSPPSQTFRSSPTPQYNPPAQTFHAPSGGGGSFAPAPRFGGGNVAPAPARPSTNVIHGGGAMRRR